MVVGTFVALVNAWALETFILPFCWCLQVSSDLLAFFLDFVDFAKQCFQWFKYFRILGGGGKCYVFAIYLLAVVWRTRIKAGLLLSRPPCWNLYVLKLCFIYLTANIRRLLHKTWSKQAWLKLSYDQFRTKSDETRSHGWPRTCGKERIAELLYKWDWI